MNLITFRYKSINCFFFPIRYQDLMDKGEERKRKLEDSIQRYSLLRDAHELESWINDKVSSCIKFVS